jgi:hypothetical protein
MGRNQIALVQMEQWLDCHQRRFGEASCRATMVALFVGTMSFIISRLSARKAML